MAKSFTKTNDYILKKLEILNFQGDKLSLENTIKELVFNESIYENFISGYLVIDDANDLSQFFPLIGEETIIFEYSSDETKIIKHKFHVYRVETSDPDDTTEIMMHKLYFISSEALLDQSTLISKSYLKKEIHKIIPDIFDKIKIDNKLFKLEKTKNVYHCVIPNWSPSQSINWLCSLAQHEKYIGGGFLFFQNNDGFNFTCIEELLDQTTTAIFRYTLQNQSKEVKPDIDKKDSGSPQSNAGQSQDGFGIKKIKQLSGTADTLKFLSEGMYANKYIAYDNMAKKYNIVKFDYKKDFNKTEHLNDFKLCSNDFKYTNPEQRVSIIPSNLIRGSSSYFKKNEGEVSSNRLEEFSHIKTSLYSQITARQFEVTFNGNSLITCGKVIRIEMPSVTKLDLRKKDSHRFNRRRFLIVSCKHKFTQQYYEITSRCISDSSINEFENKLN